MQQYQEGVVEAPFGDLSTYVSTAPQLGAPARFPALKFYSSLLAGPVLWLCRKAAKGLCDDSAWVHASLRVTELIERVGCPVSIEGMENISATRGPCVFVANHMSTLETFMLPGIIRPHRAVTFVVKKSLVSLPVFGAVMRSRDPIVVGRTNPREDLTAVLEGGVERLKKGISIIVFPQSTRTPDFDPQHFNTIGVKLARKAGVPVVPLALKTDAWGTGKKLKELGPIKSGLPVRYKLPRPWTSTAMAARSRPSSAISSAPIWPAGARKTASTPSLVPCAAGRSIHKGRTLSGPPFFIRDVARDYSAGA